MRRSNAKSWMRFPVPWHFSASLYYDKSVAEKTRLTGILLHYVKIWVSECLTLKIHLYFPTNARRFNTYSSKLTWKIKMYCTEMHGVDNFKVTRYNREGTARIQTVIFVPYSYVTNYTQLHILALLEPAGPRMWEPHYARNETTRTSALKPKLQASKHDC